MMVFLYRFSCMNSVLSLFMLASENNLRSHVPLVFSASRQNSHTVTVQSSSNLLIVI